MNTLAKEEHSPDFVDSPSCGTLPQPERDPPCNHLLKLPPEIRNIIYEMVLSSPTTTHVVARITSPPYARKSPSALSLLQTCRTINKEAQEMFYFFNRLFFFDTTSHIKRIAGLGIPVFLRQLNTPRLHAIWAFTVLADRWETFTAVMKRVRTLPNLKRLGLVLVVCGHVRTWQERRPGRERRFLSAAVHRLPHSMKEIRIRALRTSDMHLVERWKSTHLGTPAIEAELNSILVSRRRKEVLGGAAEGHVLGSTITKIDLPSVGTPGNT